MECSRLALSDYRCRELCEFRGLWTVAGTVNSVACVNNCGGDCVLLALVDCAGSGGFCCWQLWAVRQRAIYLKGKQTMMHSTALCRFCYLLALSLIYFRRFPSRMSLGNLLCPTFWATLVHFHVIPSVAFYPSTVLLHLLRVGQLQHFVELP